MSDLAVETHGLRKRFGRKLAVADLSLSVRQGEVFGFLGPNGAGKTTSLKMLLGLVAPSAGRAALLGAPVGDRRARAGVGFLPEHFRFQDWLTGREILRFHGRLFGLHGRALHARADALLERVRLTEAADRKLREYSKGMLQRVGLALALVNEPRLVFLDEPTSGLDPIGRLLSPAAGAANESAAVAGAAGPGATGWHRLKVADDAALPEIARWLVGRGVALHELRTVRRSLEALFLEIMGDDQAPG